MKHTQKLEDWQLTFANPEEFCTSEDFDFEAGCFIEFVEDNLSRIIVNCPPAPKG